MAGWHHLLLGILGLALLMVVHEGGHFLAARAYGMRVTRFSIGFGPTFFKIVPNDGYFWFTTAADKLRFRLWKHDPERHGPTIYQVAMIPFLAYVQIAGMNPLEEVDPADKASYANASLIGRVVTIFSGPLANYLFASVLFFFSFYFGGKPPTDVGPLPSQVNVIEGMPASRSEMKDNDRIVEVAGVPIDRWDKMKQEISKHPSESIAVVVEREGQRITMTITPDNDGGEGKIGVQPVPPPKVPVAGVGEATMLALKAPPMVVKNLVVGLSLWITGKVEGKFGGPVGIAKEAAEEAKRGWTDLLWFLGVLSAYLGAFNLIPFPALDGGRLMFLGYEATTRRRPNARVEAHIHAIGLVMMLGLMLYVTVFNDFGLGSK